MYKCPVCGGDGMIIRFNKDSEYPLLQLDVDKKKKALAMCTKCGVLFMVTPIYRKKDNEHSKEVEDG
jgi:transcription elongation factor Elf1